MALRWGNESLFDTIEKELPQSTFYWLMISICMSISWVIYITYYNSRVLGLILTMILNHFIKHGHIKFGSFSISVLSGKIMFRDMHWVTEDYSVRVQLGLAIFRWWRPLTLKEITEDLSHSETRLSVYLDSFEWHIYNRSSVYSELETLFGLEPTLKQQQQEQQQTEPKETSVSRSNGPGGVESKWQWRDLIPVIKVDISSGRILFGNYHMSTTLSANFGDTHMVYTTKPASTPFDQFMHVLTCKMENLRVMFVPAPGDEPPRIMGDGFVVLHSSNADIYYYYDEPGLVPYEPEMVQLADGDMVARRTWPCWGMDVKCGKGTDISYGPWADRQREKLLRFFFPQNYQPLEATVLPSPGEVRMSKCFDFKMSVQAKCTIDILFTKDKVTQAIHMNIQAGSYLDATVPYILETDGYTTKVNGQLMNVDATSSLPFRSFLECETLQFDIEAMYPKCWNDHQKWRLDLTACKSTVYLIFDHKYFFADLVNDWSSKSRDDLYHFVPYTWQVCFLLKQFELITLVNEYNWIDCFGSTPENAHIAVCGDTLDVSFVLPFVDFLPPTVSLPIIFKGESAVLSLYVPEKSTSRHALLSIARTMKIVGRDGKELPQPFSSEQSQGKWRRTTEKSKGWVDCMEAPSVAITLNYMYHPMPVLEDNDSGPVESTSSHGPEEVVLNPPHLIPLRPLRPRKKQPSGVSIEEFDASKLEADVISVNVVIAPSVLCTYGSLVRNILHLKENYLGEDSTFTDYEAVDTTKDNSVFEHIDSIATKQDIFDPRAYRPFEVKVEVTLHEIQAHLVKNCKPDDPPCPWVYIERLSVEVVKKYEETKVQVLVSPAYLLASDKVKRPLPHAHLQDGHMCLSGLQIRGHAMFSHEGLPIDSETLEYAWLVEITVGDLSGRVTAPQLQTIVEALEELVFLVEDAENCLQRPALSEPLCQHKVVQATCCHTSRDFPCPSSDDLRYTMTRVTVDGINVYLVEAGSALSLQLYPIRLSTCNLHGQNNKAGITVLVPHIKVKQFVLSLPTMHQYNGDTDLWLESGSVSLGPITVNSAMALEHSELRHIQDVFLKCHDRRSRRLDFLWPQEGGATLAGKCGCVGGCTFFGNNRNGAKVFQPGACDSQRGFNSVMYHQEESESSFGFGQSILHSGEFVFYTPSIPSSEDTLRACRRGIPNDIPDIPDGETARSSVTLVEQESTKSLLRFSESPEGSSSSSRDDIAAETNDNELTEDPVSSQVVDRGIYRDKVKSSGLPPDHPLSGGLRESWATGSVFYADHPIPDTQSTSTPRVPNVVDGDDVLSSCSSPTRQGVLSHGSPASVRRHDSFSSMRSLTMSQRSSLASPILQRLSSETSIQKGSSPSVTGSEKYFSCTEDSDMMSNRGNDSIGALSDYQGASPGNQSGSFWFSHDDDPNTRTVIMTSPDTDGDSSDDSGGSFVSAASSDAASSSDVVRRKKGRKGAPQYIDADTIREQASASECHLVSEPDDVTPLLSETPTQESTNVTDYVNLHNQISQPITRSPILISSYVSHMTQLKCTHWSALAPVPHLASSTSNPPDKRFPSSASTVVPPSGQNSSLLIPQFVVVQPGFTSVTMTAKKETSFFSRMPSDSTDSDKDVSTEAGRETGNDCDLSEIDGFMTTEDGISNTTAIVNLKGPIDVMISPLLLETLQRYVEAVTPALSTLHVSSVVDLLHRRVSAATSHSKALEGDDMENDVSLDDIKGTSQCGRVCVPLGVQEPEVNTTTSEPGNRTNRVQVMFSISRVNIRMLQMSLIEEVVSFSALDRIKELMCVSIFCACLDSITFTLLANNQLEKSAESIHKTPSDSTTPGKHAGQPASHDHPRASKKVAPAPCKMREKPRKAHTSEQAMKLQKEDSVGSLNIARIHFQLRRLRQKTNLLNSHVILTTIPEHRSKVTFVFPPEENGTTEVEDIVGFIMFECGLEEIDLKGMWRWGYSPTPTMEDSLHLQQAETLLQDTQRKVTFYNEASEDIAEDSAAERVQRQRSGPHEKKTKPTAAGSSEKRSSGLDDVAPEMEQSDGEDEVDGGETPESSCTPLEGNASSCVLQFQTVWFNFAAPPSKKRKTESTRLDWNLLSTATPAIKAWMNPAHHLTVAITDLLTKYKYRLNTVMACIMVEALEIQGIHVPPKGKYSRLTRRSRALQVDPSCQLMTVLRRYLAQIDLANVEASINSNSIPQFITIQKGLLALTRQWKNVLYLPHFTDNDFRSAEKLPYTLTFAIPQDTAVDVTKDDATLDTDVIVADDGGDTISDSYEVVDENMSLLKAEGGSFHTAQSAVQESVTRGQHQAVAEKGRHGSGPGDPPVKYVVSGPNKLAPTLSNPMMPPPSLKETPVAASEPQPGRATMGMRLGSFLGVTSLQSHLTRNESYISIQSVCSASGGSSVDGQVPDPTPGRASFAQHLSRLDQRTEDTDDLYRWMQRQQDFTKTAYYTSMAGMPETFTKHKGSEQSIDELPSEHSLAATLIPTAFQPVAAQVLFKPLLTTLGLHIDAVKRSALMKKFGGNVSIKGALNALRVDIVESEEVVWPPRTAGKGGAKPRTRKTAHFSVDSPTPALLFDNFTITAAMKDNIDLQKVVPVPASVPNRNVGRQSIHSVKLAMDHMEAKPTTTKVYFDVYCHGISQHVNVPLLRLVHQFVTMVETVSDTHQQLREVSSLTKDADYRRHVKNDSKGSSSSTETTSPSVQSGTPVGSSLSPQYSEGAPVDSIGSQPHRPDQLSLQSPGGRSGPKSTYSKTESVVHSPLHSYAESVMVASGELSSPAVAERTIVDEITENTPKCWHTLYHLLELYSIMPETNAIDPRSSRSRLSVIDEESDVTPVVTSEWRESKMDSLEQLERQADGKKAPRRNTITRSMFMQSVLIGERVPLIIFGTAKVKRVRISAVLSGLKLEAEVRNVHASATHKERVKGVMKKKSHESSVTAHVGQSMIVLREGDPPDIQTVVTVNIGQSQGLYSTFCKDAKERNSGLVTIGVITIDIPQHPVALHGVVYRSSKRLSCTLQEFIRPPGKVRSQESEGSLLSQQASRHSELSEFTSNTPIPSLVSKLPQKPADDKLVAPSVVHFKAVLRGLVLGASLLPSLRARYKMEEVQCSGVTGRKPKCTVDLPAHSLSFTSKVTIPSSLPSSASINLPPVHIHGDYRQHSVASTIPDSGGLMEGHHLRAGHYLQATADVGVFEHSLTTDLLNHLVFVQKVFMKEVNELVQKVSGGDQPVSIFGDLAPKSNLARRIEPLLYSISLRLKGIQITATTPTSIAVRLETGVIDLDLTNRVVNNRYCATNDNGATYVEPSGSSHKLFVKMQVDLNLALGTLLKNPMFEEAEAEFQHLASFATRFGLRNALQDEMIPDMNKDQEALLISLTRPVIYVQPVSFDKAVLVWLNYKNAYEYWNEQRAALNKEVQTATMQVFEKIPMSSHASSTPSVTAPTSNSTLFLQVTASDMGMCLPLNSYISPGMLATTSRMIDEPTAATVMTLESTQISVCSFGSMVSKGKFQGFCLRFADDFEVSWDDWKPEKNQDVVMNAMVVPEGTYEICSRTMTVAPGNTKKNIKWMMNINWKMQGLDVHLDTNIGQRLSMLGSTLTSLARDQSDDTTDSQSEGVPKEELETTPATRLTTFSEDLPRFFFDNTIDKKTRARLIVDAMNKQAKKVEELRSSTASQGAIEPEERKLNILETAVFNDFRQDIMKKLNRQVTRATTIKEKLGLGYKPVHHRSKSVGTNMMRELKRSDSDLVESTRHASYTGILRDKQTSFDINDVATNQRHGRTLSLDTNSLELPLKSLDAASQAQTEFPAHSMRRSSLATPSSSESFSYEGREGEDNGEAVSSLPSSLGQGTSSSEELDIFNQENLAFLAERFGTDHATISSTYGDTRTHHKRAPVSEPNIDFELDIKLDVDCGKCALHPKDTEAEVKSGNGKRRDSFSPRFRRRNMTGKKLNPGEIPTIKIHPSAAPTCSSTVFILPGVDIRVHYSSKMNHDTPSPDTAYTGLSNPRTPLKKANLYIWLTLQQQLSQEMLISPVLLDFMEQALEPIPLPDNKPSSTTTSRASESNAINTSASSLVATYSSFPVDIIVYFQMESSIVRFTCLPQSRVECLVRLPSLSLIFSTKRSIADDNFNGASGTDAGTNNDSFNSGGIPDVGHTRRVSGYHTEVTSGGGLSVTGCLNNFSMFIFHPYGGMTKKTSFTSLESTFRKAATGSTRQTVFDATTGRKDALSLNVEFIKVNVSRSRKGIIHSDWTPGAATGGATLRPHDTHGTKSHNIVRFSAICDVGFASFNYDMRRLSEILAFPKAWYSRTLARHLFLGEEMGFGMDSTLSDDENDVIPSFLVTPSTPHGRTQTLLSRPVDGSMHSPMSRSPGLSPWRTTSSTSANRAPSTGETSPRPSRDSSLAGLLASPQAPSKPIMHWETLVIFAVNLSQLDLTINMSNIMGNTLWSTKDVKSQGELSIDSSGHKNMKILAGLGESKLEAQGGIVGCKIDVQNFWTNLKIKEDPGKEPYHKVGLQLQIVETRLDYMGSSMMMGRMCDLDIVLKDEWRLDRGGSGDDDLQPLATKRPVLIFMHGDLSWDLMHLMISRSTTPDLLRMFTKLDEFFRLHIKSSAHVLSSLGPVQKPKPSKRKSDLSDTWISRMRHHRHWQKVLANISGCKLSMFDFTLPTEGTIAGGTMKLRGNSFSLACFHGINFRCKSWALFTMDEPIVHFATESQEIINDDGETCAHIVQNLSFQLGHNMADLTQRKHMATVCLLNRGHHVPPHFTSVQEWFHYAFATNELKDLYHFPEMSHDDATLQMSPSNVSVASSERRRRQQKLNHDTEIIFVLPSLQMNFKTIHQQGVEEPRDGDPKPLVECSFVTEFEDHIFITMDAESILFIHDLITSYLREKDKDGAESGLRSPYDRHATVESPTEVLKQDYREYQCHTWVLEPTIRLISWGGNKIDPVGVDFILQKLGFQHARLTIPKWIQRGFMDPLDGILSVLVKQLIKSLKEEQNQSIDGRAESDIM